MASHPNQGMRHVILMSLLVGCALAAVTAASPTSLSAALQDRLRELLDARTTGQLGSAPAAKSQPGPAQADPSSKFTSCINANYQSKNMSWELTLKDSMPALKVRQASKRSGAVPGACVKWRMQAPCKRHASSNAQAP